MRGHWSLKTLDQPGEPFPVVATPLTAAVQRPVEHPRYLIKEVIDAVEVAPDTVVQKVILVEIDI